MRIYVSLAIAAIIFSTSSAEAAQRFCVPKRGGTVIMRNSRCRGSEKEVTLSLQGQNGSIGPMGAQGNTGPVGARGPQGEMGQPGMATILPSIATVSMTLPAGGNFEFAVGCPSGMRVLGGGCEGNSTSVVVSSSNPLSPSTGWHCVFVNISASPVNVVLQAHGQCTPGAS